MQNLAKKKTTFSQDIPLMVIFSAEFCDEFRGVPWSSCTIVVHCARMADFLASDWSRANQ